MRCFYTWSELTALELLVRAGEVLLTTSNRFNPHDAGNYVIELAEKIKAERSVAAMFEED